MGQSRLSPPRVIALSVVRRQLTIIRWRWSLVLLLLLAGLLRSTFPTGAAAPGLDRRFGIAEGVQNEGAMADIGAGWERLVLPWPQIQPGGPQDFSGLGVSLPRSRLQADLARGVTVVGLFQFTPDWAASDPSQGQRSVPKNLDLPYDDPNNYFANYVYRTAQFYAGQIDQWVLWNEPEFRPGDPGAGGSFTWLGTDEQFAQLTRVGYLAIKRANPNATVSVAGTSYWIDQNSGRPQYYDRLLSILSQDPNAAANNFYHDAVSLNLYRAPDDLVRVVQVFKSIQQRYGIDRPVWLTETNAMPTDDHAVPCPDMHANDPIKTTMDQQAAYAIQAFALAAASGYSRYEIYQMVDANPCTEPAVWGVTRDDGSRRPVATALQTAIANFSGFTRAQFVPLVRDTQKWSPWPDDPSSQVPNWQVYQVAFDRPGSQRVTALWNGDGAPLRARFHQTGTSARVVDRLGNAQPLQSVQGWWVVDLPPATAYFYLSDQIKDPDGYHFIGGDPLLVVEDGVDPSAPVLSPALGDPGSTPADFQVAVNPADGQTAAVGQPADFFVRTRGYEGFSTPITLSVVQWSTQRFPTPQDPSSLPLQVTFPSAVNPGDTATIHIDSSGADPGIYYLSLQATSNGITHPFDLALVLN